MAQDISVDSWTERARSLESQSKITTFNILAVAEAMDTVFGLKGTEAGLRTIRTRKGQWKSWDPNIFGVDEATEGGYIKRLKELHRPIILLSEESERVEINLDVEGELLYCVSDPFDGSWLFNRQLSHWWYSSLACYKKDFTPLSAAISDIHQRLIAFADDEGAFLIKVGKDQLTDKRELDESYRQSLAGDPITELSNACVQSYGLKPKKFLKPLLEKYGDLIYSCKMFYPNGGPYGFVNVATGHVDVYLAVQQPFVDVFSSLQIAFKADLVVSDFYGRPFKLETEDCRTSYDLVVSRNQKLHEEVLKKIAK